MDRRSGRVSIVDLDRDAIARSQAILIDDVRIAAVGAEGKTELSPMSTLTRPDGGRGFGFTGGHIHRGWQNDQQRKLVLIAIACAAKVEIPAEGINNATPTDEELKEGLDEKKGR